MSIRLTDLPVADPLNGSEITIAVQSGVSKQVGMAQMKTYATADSTAALLAHTSNVSNPHNVTKSQVGLSNVDNTSDANKPVSTAQQVALDNIKSQNWMGI